MVLDSFSSFSSLSVCVDVMVDILFFFGIEQKKNWGII
jgi:hypothetical protein